MRIPVAPRFPHLENGNSSCAYRPGLLCSGEAPSGARACADPSTRQAGQPCGSPPALAPRGCLKSLGAQRPEPPARPRTAPALLCQLSQQALARSGAALPGGDDNTTDRDVGAQGSSGPGWGEGGEQGISGSAMREGLRDRRDPRPSPAAHPIHCQGTRGCRSAEHLAG